MISVGQVHSNGYMSLMTEQGGWTFREDSFCGRYIKDYVDWFAHQYPDEVLWPLHQMWGVYWFWMKDRTGKWQMMLFDSRCSNTVVPNGKPMPRTILKKEGHYEQEGEWERGTYPGETRRETPL